MAARWEQNINYVILTKCRPCLITVRKQSWGKVMFLHLSVSHSVHRGCIPACIGADTPSPGRHPPPWADPSPRRPLQWTVRILLEFIIVCVKGRSQLLIRIGRWGCAPHLGPISMHFFAKVLQNNRSRFPLPVKVNMPTNLRFVLNVFWC